VQEGIGLAIDRLSRPAAGSILLIGSAEKDSAAKRKRGELPKELTPSSIRS
jgi:hypothetical protein